MSRRLHCAKSHTGPTNQHRVGVYVKPAARETKVRETEDLGDGPFGCIRL